MEQRRPWNKTVLSLPKFIYTLYNHKSNVKVMTFICGLSPRKPVMIRFVFVEPVLLETPVCVEFSLNLLHFNTKVKLLEWIRLSGVVPTKVAVCSLSTVSLLVFQVNLIDLEVIRVYWYSLDGPSP